MRYNISFIGHILPFKTFDEFLIRRMSGSDLDDFLSAHSLIQNPEQARYNKQWDVSIEGTKVYTYESGSSGCERKAGLLEKYNGITYSFDDLSPSLKSRILGIVAFAIYGNAKQDLLEEVIKQSPYFLALRGFYKRDENREFSESLLKREMNRIFNPVDLVTSVKFEPTEFSIDSGEDSFTLQINYRISGTGHLFNMLRPEYPLNVEDLFKIPLLPIDAAQYN